MDKNTPQAFTLFECLIVLALLSILLLFALPAYQKFHDRYILNAQVRQLMTALRFARASAIFSGQRIILCGSRDHWHCSNNLNEDWLIFFAGTSDYSVKDPKQRIKIITHSLNGTITFNRNSRITFISDGSLVNHNGTIHITCGNLSRNLVLSTTGRVRVA